MPPSESRLVAAIEVICNTEVICSAVEDARLWCGQISTPEGRLIMQTANVYASQEVALGGMAHFVTILRRGRAIERRPPGREERFLLLGEVSRCG